MKLNGILGLGIAPCATIAIAVAVWPDPPSGPWDTPARFGDDPAAQGRMDAEAAISAGRPLRMRYGEAGPEAGAVHPETGLLYSGWGCIVPEVVHEYVAAYNDTIDAARAAGRLAGMGFKDRLMTREDAAARIGAAGRRFALGDPPIPSPDGAHRVVIERQPISNPRDDVLFVHVETSDGRDRLGTYGVQGPVTIAFDAGGTTLLVESTLRVETGDRVIATYDLPHRQRLQYLAPVRR